MLRINVQVGAVVDGQSEFLDGVEVVLTHSQGIATGVTTAQFGTAKLLVPEAGAGPATIVLSKDGYITETQGETLTEKPHQGFQYALTAV